MSPKNQSYTSQSITPREGEFLFYTTPDGGVKIEALFRDESIWMTQKKLAELFDVDRTVVTKHLRNIFDAGELHKSAVCAKIAHTAQDGKTYNTTFYSLFIQQFQTNV